MLERMWRKGNPQIHWWECKLVQPLWKTVWRFLKRLKIDPAITLLDIYPEKTKTVIQKATCTPKVHGSITYNSQDMETTQVPIKRRWD